MCVHFIFEWESWFYPFRELFFTVCQRQSEWNSTEVFGDHDHDHRLKDSMSWVNIKILANFQNCICIWALLQRNWTAQLDPQRRPLHCLKSFPGHSNMQSGWRISTFEEVAFKNITWYSNDKLFLWERQHLINNG